MSDTIICTRVIQGGSFSSEPGPTRFLKVPEKKISAPSHQINQTIFIKKVVDCLPLFGLGPRGKQCAFDILGMDQTVLLF